MAYKVRWGWGVFFKHPTTGRSTSIVFPRMEDAEEVQAILDNPTPEGIERMLRKWKLH